MLDLSRYPHGPEASGSMLRILQRSSGSVGSHTDTTGQDVYADALARTPGKDLEARLNKEYGPGNPYYEDLCRYVRQGLEEGWVAQTEISGPKYRRGKITLPTAETRYFSITTVYMESQDEFRGQYHAHPYGEINCVVQVRQDRRAEGDAGMAGRGMDVSRPRDASLS